jgi:hypothetical protein
MPWAIAGGIVIILALIAIITFFYKKEYSWSYI